MSKTVRIRIFAALLVLGALATSALAQAGTGGGGEGEPFGFSGLDSLLKSIPPDSLPVLPDSLRSQVPDSLADAMEEAGADEFDIPASPGVHPKFKSDTRSSERRTDISNSMDLSMVHPSTWILAGRIFYDRGIPRELSRETTDKGLSISSSKRLMDRFPFSLSANRNRKLQEQNKGESTYRRDEWDTSSLSALTSGGWDLTDWLGMNGKLSASANQSDARSNKGLRKKSSDGTRDFAARMDFKPIPSFNFTTGYSGMRGLGTGELLDLRDQVETRRDSLNLRSEIRRGAKFTLSVSGGRQETSNERLDFQRDEFNVVLSDSIPIKEQVLQRDWGGNIDLSWRPAGFMDLSMGFDYEVGEKRARASNFQDRDEWSQNFNLRLGLRPWKNQDIDVTYKDGTNWTDEYTAEKTSYKKEAQLKSSQEFSETLSLVLDAYFFLSQDFYGNIIKNPLDRDQYKNRFTVKVTGQPFSWLSAENSLAYSLSRDIMIRSTKSISNKDKTSLIWNSRLDYTLYSRFKVSQIMEVNVGKDDFVFTEEQNVLDRESTLITSATLPLYGTLRLDLAHEFKLRQLGSFLPDPDTPGNPETFFLSRRVKKEDFRIGFSTTLLKYLKFSVKESLGREVTYYYADGSQDVVPYGSLDSGLAYDRSFGRAGTVRIDLQHQAKFGRFVRENQRSLWIPTLSIEYNF